MSFQEAEWKKVDILKGLLILFVVLGHTTFRNVAFHDIIFWFHMPLFFALSGAAFKGGVDDLKAFAYKKAKRFLPTYLAWFILISILEGSIFKAKSWVRFIWGGRVCGGVYWYITVLLFTVILFAQMEKKLKSRKALAACLFLCLCIGTVESLLLPENLPDGGQELLHSVPWNADVTFVAIFFYGMGFLLRDLLTQEKLDILFRERFLKYVMVGIAVVAFLVLMILRFRGLFNYELDMKIVSYSNLFLNLLLPGLAAIILLWLTDVLTRTSVLKGLLISFGKSSLVIMYVHQFLRVFMEAHTPAFIGRPIVVTIIAVAVGYGLYRLFSKNTVTKKLFITGIT